MLWPYGENVLVPGDHLDIVGHYQSVKAGRKPGDQSVREFRTYDALRSLPRFEPQTFEEVWTEVFNFAVGGNPHGAREDRHDSAMAAAAVGATERRGSLRLR